MGTKGGLKEYVIIKIYFILFIGIVGFKHISVTMIGIRIILN